MVLTCCVDSCRASTRIKSVWWMRGVQFFKLPKKGRVSWLRAIRRPVTSLSRYTRICSLHFRHPLKEQDPHEIPSRFHWTDWGRKSVEHADIDLPLPEAIYHASCKQGPDVPVEKAIGLMNVTPHHPATPELPSLSLVRLHDMQLHIGGEEVCGPVSDQGIHMKGIGSLGPRYEATPAPSMEHLYAQSQLQPASPMEKCDASTQTSEEELSSYRDTLQSKEQEIAELQTEKNRLLTANDELSSKLKNIGSQLRQNITEKMLESDESVQQCTGVPNKATLFGLHEVIRDRLPKLHYWRGGKDAEAKKAKAEEAQADMDCKKSGGRKRVLTSQQEFLITLCRLRLGLTCAFLGLIFNVSDSHISSVFTTWISLIAVTFKPQIKAPPLVDVQKNLPLEFRGKFRNVRWVLDCTEFKTEKPKTPTAQHKLYSQYKSSTTCKCLISITPDGYINFVSKLFGGNASDRYITKESGLLDLLESGDAVMADRGFNIRDLCLPHRVELIIPPFTRLSKSGNGRRLNKAEILQTRNIARSRIHVERAIERIKNFKLLCHTIPLNLKDTVDQMLITACFLCNLQPQLVK